MRGSCKTLCWCVPGSVAREAGFESPRAASRRVVHGTATCLRAGPGAQSQEEHRAKPCSREELSKGRLLESLAQRCTGSAPPRRGWSQEWAPLAPENLPRPSAPPPRPSCPLHLHPHFQRSRQGPQTLSRLPAQLPGQVCPSAPAPRTDPGCGTGPRTPECPASMSALWQKVDGEEVINLSNPLRELPIG